MDLRRQFESKISKKREEIEALKKQLELAETYLQALLDSLKLIPKGSMPQENTLRVGSALAQARDAIKTAGEPLHISKILAAIGKEVNKENRVSLSGSLSSYARDGRIFSKPAPNTFSLIEMENNVSDDVPPEGFGETAVPVDHHHEAGKP